MEQASEKARHSVPTRRWQRHPVDLPVRLPVKDGSSTTMVSGRGTELSPGGMGLYAGVLVKPGDLLEVEFEDPCHFRVTAIVRYRSGYWFGLEFLTPLPS